MHVVVDGDASAASGIVSLTLAFALGLRHALDPDHVSAVATLTAGEGDRGARRAMGDGLAWGAAHALTLLTLGAPVVIAGSWIPDGVHAAAEVVVGLLIAIL